MSDRTVLALVDGARVVVPDSVDLITPYVLREQGDWFEDEIKFVRCLLEPGQQAIDIGANYGVYAVSMARAVGPAGKLWAFEPASATFDFLRASVAENGFHHVMLEQSALSSRTGTASLSLNVDSELNALVQAGAEAVSSETVRLTTLDERAAFHDWRGIDFVKIDAEGEELEILRGGQDFFATGSPLVMYEVRAGHDLRLELIQAFAQSGYRSYRLVPGLNLLAPLDERMPADGYLLNLFCCKPDRAAWLASRQLLAAASPFSESTGHSSVSNAASIDRYDWSNTLATLPYASALASQWRQHTTDGNRAEVLAALACHAQAKDATLAAPQRLAALEEAFIRLRSLCEKAPVNLRLLSLARVAREFGARTIAVQALGRFLGAGETDPNAARREPFLAPGIGFDAIKPGLEISEWVRAAALEEFERICAFSSFYTGAAAKKRVSDICRREFAAEEMYRRKDLLEKRFPSGG